MQDNISEKSTVIDTKRPKYENDEDNDEVNELLKELNEVYKQVFLYDKCFKFFALILKNLETFHTTKPLTDETRTLLTQFYYTLNEILNSINLGPPNPKKLESLNQSIENHLNKDNKTNLCLKCNKLKL